MPTREDSLDLGQNNAKIFSPDLLLADYTDVDGASTTSESLTIVICAPGGAGKSSITAELLRSDANLWFSRSWTTRPRREGEPEHAYVWVSREEFEQQLESGFFLEHDEHFGHLYGTPMPDPPEGMDILLEIDVIGAEQVRNSDSQALVILILPPSREVQEIRLNKRGDAPEAVEARLLRADMEEELGRKLADAIVLNDVLEEAVAEVAAIIEDRRKQREDANR